MGEGVSGVGPALGPSSVRDSMYCVHVPYCGPYLTACIDSVLSTSAEKGQHKVVMDEPYPRWPYLCRDQQTSTISPLRTATPLPRFEGTRVATRNASGLCQLDQTSKGRGRRRGRCDTIGLHRGRGVSDFWPDFFCWLDLLDQVGGQGYVWMWIWM